MRDINHEQCISACLSCYKVCTDTKSHCLKGGGDHATKKHITMLEDCTEICALSADFMLRESEVERDICKLCAEICEECSNDCKEFSEDEVMIKCADECMKCAEACGVMISMEDNSLFQNL